MTVRHLLLLLLMLVVGAGFAQSNPAAKQRKKDSLLGVLKQNERDSNHVKALLDLVRMLREKSPDSALTMATDAVSISIAGGHRKLLPKAYNALAVCYIKKGLSDTALVLYDSAVAAALRVKDYKTASLAANAAGYQLTAMVDYTKALEYYFLGYDYAKLSGDVYSIMNSLNSISGVYYSMHNYELALEYSRKMLAEAEARKDQSTIGNVYGNIGAIYSEAGKTDSAIYFTEKAIDVFVSMGLSKGYANYYINAASYMHEAGRYKDAEEMAMKGFNMALASIDMIMISRAYTTLAKIEMTNEHPDSALVHARKGYEYAKNLNSAELMLSAMEVMANAYLSLGKIETARALYERIIALQDSVYDEDNARLLSEMQVRFDTRRNKEENALLAKENEIQAERIRQGNILMMAGAVATALILVVLLLVYRGYKQKQRSSKVLAERNKLISHQRDEISIRNKEITDSINYAKRIQEAILPAIPDFVRAAGEAFVLFHPKDIVSGDFYWFNSQSAHLFFAAGDCTGHGVPGGFMSVLGMERLADFAAASSSPGEILGMLNHAIKRSLRQESDASETRDGMDIALCALDRTNKKLHFAGANRPLWIVRNGELHETQATKTAIGGLTPDNQVFTSHVIDVRAGDMIYLSTDGYADQFGGTSNKKFMTKNFKKMLVSIADKSVHEQEATLVSIFSDWKKNYEQVDDVLVIGIRVS